MRQKIDYNKISGTYDARYKADPMNGVLDHLKEIIGKNDPDFAAEIGCGTGYWMEKLLPVKKSIVGIDLSAKMLSKAKMKNESFPLINGDACNLPFNRNQFDLIYLVNSIHLFGNINRFIHGAFYCLNNGGVIDIIFADIRHPEYQWYIYEIFEGTYRFDLCRIPDSEGLISVLKETGFGSIESKIIDTICSEFKGEEVRNDPFLHKNNTSTLAALSDDEYESGLSRMKKVIDENSGRIFKSKIIFRSITAYKKTDSPFLHLNNKKRRRLRRL